MNKVSDCCGASPRAYGDFDVDDSDIGRCSACGEPCKYVKEDDNDDGDGNALLVAALCM